MDCHYEMRNGPEIIAEFAYYFAIGSDEAGKFHCAAGLPEDALAELRRAGTDRDILLVRVCDVLTNLLNAFEREGLLAELMAHGYLTRRRGTAEFAAWRDEIGEIRDRAKPRARYGSLAASA